MSRVGPLGTYPHFLSPLGLLKCQDFLSFLFILKLSYSKPFYNTLNYPSTTNIQEVRKFITQVTKPLCSSWKSSTVALSTRTPKIFFSREALLWRKRWPENLGKWAITGTQLLFKSRGGVVNFEREY